MTALQMILLLIFVFTTFIGYRLIKNVPSLLHTPLMSGMNALSGVTILGALIATSLSLANGNAIVSWLMGGIAIILAMINVCGGFAVTDRMLKMFSKKDNRNE
ncbi:MAG: NAD(P) transhydrogenase subunit alpha [Spirochaetes bacterium]|nr:NAD(P) transhydrogenase subunit alpha [Spirochaetota bacterium]HOJ29368.1 NAD(P) transhydrogenase subunit alpha [Spirochaetota bacterium]HOM10292.1 NAD(P) transhydrogenase subunit alpha [Spirochaetota bacterium]HPP50135.1 NAD(P) transhydrogenase subunit alpha [Spirochaetota bacterium]